MTEREALKLALEALENVYGKGKRCKAAIAAIKEVLAQPEQEPVGTVKELFTQAAWEKHDLRGSTKVYTTPPQPEQSQVEETLRYEIDALEIKLAECRAQQPEPVIDKSAAIRIATALGWEPKRKPLSEERIDDIWNLHCDEMGYVSVSDAVELARDFEAAHDIKE